MSKKNQCFIALHIGAGFHSPTKEGEYKNVCNKACKLGISLLREGKTCIEAVEKVCCFLEDSPFTNSGYGSNLSMDGLVECDAGVMESSTASFGAVACLKGVKNPIKLARILLEEQLLPSKLIPPMVLAGEGARNKAISSGLQLVSNKELTSPQAFKDHCRYKQVLGDSEYENRKKMKFDQNSDDIQHSNSNNISCNSDESISLNDTISEEESDSFDTNINKELFGSSVSINKHYCAKNSKSSCSKETSSSSEGTSCSGEHRPSQDSTDCVEGSKLQDTIGVICVDNKLNIASGVSSGGIVLKHSGRVSHASHYGCGCWAFRYAEDFSVGCCTSGCGELLIRTGLAKRAAEFSLDKTEKVLNYNEFIENKFLNSPYIDGMNGQRFCGLLLVKLFTDKHCTDKNLIDLQLAHTSESFCVGFMSNDMKKSQFILSRLKKAHAGAKVMSQGFTLRI